MKNNNRAIIRKITARSLSANKKRNIFLMAAIVLTTLMIASVLSLGLSFNATMAREGLRRAGTAAHIEIINLSQNGVDALKKQDYIKQVGAMRIAASVPAPWNDNVVLILAYCDEDMWENFLAPAYSDITGLYPYNEHEIMLPLGVLRQLGIDKPELGMSVDLGGLKFELSGYYTSYKTDGRLSEIVVPVSEEFFKQTSGTTIIASVIFNDAKNIGVNRQNVYSLIVNNQDYYNPEAGFPFVTSIAVFHNSSPFASPAVYVVLIIFLMFTGYLLIYNVLTISVSNDIRFYGLLKTVGTTPKQLRAIVVGQALRLCVFAIPIGAGLAALLSLGAVPLFMRAVESKLNAVNSFSPYIYIGAAVFSLLTVIIGAFLPGRKAARISPIEAVKYEGGAENNKRVLVPGGAKPARMAIRNLFRNKRRSAIVFISLFLGLTIFLSIALVTGSLDAEKYASAFGDDDFLLRYNANTFSTGADGSAQRVPSSEIPRKLGESFIDSLTAIPGISSMWTVEKAEADLLYDEAFDPYIYTSFERLGRGGLNMDETARQRYIEILKGGEIMLSSAVYGVAPDDIAALNLKNDVKIDTEAFSKGEIALIAADDPLLFDGLSKITLVFEGEPYTLSYGGIVPEGYKGSVWGSSPTIFVSKAFLESVSAPYTAAIGLRVEEIGLMPIQDFLTDMFAEDRELQFSSRIDRLTDVWGMRMFFWVFGGSTAGVLGLIGILNFVNVLTVGIISRKRELVLLEAAGMSKKQTRLMLRIEGIGYGIITLMLTATFGNAAAFWLYRLIVSTETNSDTILTFTYPLLLVGLVAVLMIMVCIITPDLAYRRLNRATLSERLREAE